MSHCRICTNLKSPFVLNNKLVCMHCDELLFDLEIECEEMEAPVKEAPATKKSPTKPATTAKK